MPARLRSSSYADSASVRSLSLLRDGSARSKLKRRVKSDFDFGGCEEAMLSDLLPYQRDFVEDFEHKYVAFCGGYGSGKTHSLVVKQLLLCFRSQGFTHLFLEPTIPLIDDVALPKWYEILDKYNIPYRYRTSPRPVFTLLLPGGDTPVLLRSLENYERLIGVNAASISGDEMDTARSEVAAKAIVKLQGRVRVGSCPQLAFASTPEGYRWMYSFFVEEASENKKLYKGRTLDNPYLAKGYYEDLLSKYPPQLVDAYLNGEFAALETAIVFYEFDIKKHCTGVFEPDRNERILFGLDFNINKCSAVFGVMRPGLGGQQLHIFLEAKAKNTFEMVDFVKSRFPDHITSGLVCCYPDASGSHESTSSTETDHEIIRGGNIKIVADSKNPLIPSTLSHANAHIRNGLVLINQTTCDELLKTVVQWAYDKKTMRPEKGGERDLSHFGDAFRYLLWHVFPRAGYGVRASGRKY